MIEEYPDPSIIISSTLSKQAVETLGPLQADALLASNQVQQGAE
jgi:hypothetical protein